MRAVKNVFDDQCVIPGAGAFEIACSEDLKDYAKTIDGKEIFGIELFAEAMLTVPKAICKNSGIDSQESLIKCSKAYRDSKTLMGIDIQEGNPINPVNSGIFDNYCVKKSFLNIGPVLVQQLFMVDEVMRAGKQVNKDRDINQ